MIAKSENKVVNPTMSPAVYEKKRNDLIKIIQAILKKSDGLPNSTRDELEETVEKLKRNSFEIVLVGEFQGGKSTTFDTICDGREISPRGSGIKTSACKISAQAIPADRPEWAKLHWKSDEELMLTMLDIVKQNLIESPEEYEVFSQKDDDGKEIIPSLSDPSVFALAEKAIAAEWNAYEENRSGYTKDNTGRLDLLQISTLILRFFNRVELASMRKKDSIEIEDLKSLVVFPERWDIRWESGGAGTAWEFSEIRFVFLGAVDCYIHCENLERLGCVITDCPGLFAGPWDTAVARSAMMRADAILYLLNGEKSVTEPELRVLSEIAKTQQSHKVFFAKNAKRAHDQIVKDLRPNDFAKISQHGFHLESEESIGVFQALLAFYSRSKLDLKSSKALSTAVVTYLDLNLLDREDMSKIQELLSNPLKLYEASNINAVLEKIETEIVTKKFESILVKGGTEMALKTLEVINGDLEEKEVAAEKDLASVEREVEAARTKLKEFQKFATTTLDKELGNGEAAETVADDYYQKVYLNQCDEFASGITTIIVNRFGGSASLLKLGYKMLFDKLPEALKRTLPRPSADVEGDPQTVAARILGKPISDFVKDVITNASRGWLCNVNQGSSPVFRLAYGQALERFASSVRQKWDAEYEADDKLFKGLKVDFDVKTMLPNYVPDKTSGQVAGSIDIAMFVKSTFWDKFVATLGGTIAGFAIVIGLEVLLFAMTDIILTGGVTMVIGIIVSGGFVKFFSDNISKKAELKMRPKITDALREEFVKETVKNQVAGIFKDSILSKILKDLKERCHRSLDRQMRNFEKRVEEVLTMKSQSIESQRIIAQKARKVRGEQIEPAKMQIEEFHRGLEDYFE